MNETESPRAWRGHEDLYAQFCEQLLNLTTSNGWERWLQFANKFRKYSYANLLLIMAQRPEATHVGGKRFWEKLGREVNPDAKPLKIWCPYQRKVVDPDEPEADPRKVTGWFLGDVYDVAETTGVELPQPVDLLEGSSPEGLQEGLLEQIGDLGFAFELVPAGELHGANGDCSHTLKKIRVREDLSPAQITKTTAHELAHALMHEQVSGYRADRGLCEQEAESVAFLVCGGLGLDTSEYSLGYVASWATGNGEIDIEALRGRLGKLAKRVQTTAAKISGGLEQSLNGISLA